MYSYLEVLWPPRVVVPLGFPHHRHLRSPRRMNRLRQQLGAGYQRKRNVHGPLLHLDFYGNWHFDLWLSYEEN